MHFKQSDDVAHRFIAVYTGCQKTVPISLLNANLFLKFLYYCNRFVSKFAIKLLLNVPPHLKCISTLHCEILRCENVDILKYVL